MINENESKFSRPDGTWISCDECPYYGKNKGRRCVNYWKQMFVRRADSNCGENLIGDNKDE